MPPGESKQCQAKRGGGELSSGQGGKVWLRAFCSVHPSFVCPKPQSEGAGTRNATALQTWGSLTCEAESRDSDRHLGIQHVGPPSDVSRNHTTKSAEDREGIG